MAVLGCLWDAMALLMRVGSTCTLHQSVWQRYHWKGLEERNPTVSISGSESEVSNLAAFGMPWWDVHGKACVRHDFMHTSPMHMTEVPLERSFEMPSSSVKH